MLNDIINEAKMANAIVLEVLEFVRPIRLQMEKVALPRVLQDALHMADNLVARGQTRVSLVAPESLPAIEGDPNQLRQLFTNLLTNAYEALDGRGIGDGGQRVTCRSKTRRASISSRPSPTRGH